MIRRILPDPDVIRLIPDPITVHGTPQDKYVPTWNATTHRWEAKEQEGGGGSEYDEENGTLVLYVDSENGSDDNDGLELTTAKKTINGALTVPTRRPINIEAYLKHGSYAMNLQSGQDVFMNVNSHDEEDEPTESVSISLFGSCDALLLQDLRDYLNVDARKSGTWDGDPDDTENPPERRIRGFSGARYDLEFNLGSESTLFMGSRPIICNYVSITTGTLVLDPTYFVRQGMNYNYRATNYIFGVGDGETVGINSTNLAIVAFAEGAQTYTYAPSYLFNVVNGNLRLDDVTQSSENPTVAAILSQNGRVTLGTFEHGAPLLAKGSGSLVFDENRITGEIGVEKDADTQYPNNWSKESVEVETDGVKDYEDLFLELRQLVDFSKLTKDSVLEIGAGVARISIIGTTDAIFGEDNYNASTSTLLKVMVYISESSSNDITRFAITPTGTTVTSLISTVPASGAVIRLTY